MKCTCVTVMSINGVAAYQQSFEDNTCILLCFGVKWLLMVIVN